MAIYRIYMLSPEGHVIAPAQLVECPDDDEAIGKARQYVDQDPIEVWEGAKRVIRLEPVG